MRSVVGFVLGSALGSALALGLLIISCAAAGAATMHRARPPGIHLRTRPQVTVRPAEAPAATARIAVPGWSDEQTRDWLNRASAASGLL